MGRKTAPGSSATGAASNGTGEVGTGFAPGHYYSPIPDYGQLLSEPRRSQIWPSTPPETPGIEWRGTEQVRLVTEVFAAQPRIQWAATTVEASPREYVYKNPRYPAVDAWLLEGMLQWLAPRRMIEVGCGFSSLVTARTSRERLDGALELVCVDPYPQPWLERALRGVAEILPRPVQDVPLARFDALGAGDVLFVDTSHTVKTGGDVPWLYNRVLPLLRPGVVVHLHDIFLPRDYPEAWIRYGWGWNEQYLVQSFLAFNRGFEILAGATYLLEHHREALAEAFPEFHLWAHRGGSSLWIRRVGASS